MSRYRPYFPNSIPPKEITGLQLALRRRSKGQSIELAVAIVLDETKPRKFTGVQAARLCGVSPQSVSRLLRARLAAEHPPKSQLELLFQQLPEAAE
jgi:hypothetical protein